jgi:hypothetical protein
VPVKFVYALLGIRQSLMFNWMARGFIHPTPGTKRMRQKQLDFAEICWSCVFFYFARGVRADHKTLAAWRSLVLRAVEKGYDYLQLYYGSDLAFNGWSAQQANSMMQAMTRHNESGTDAEFHRMASKAKRSAATITINLKMIREYIEAAIEKYEG